MENLLFYKYVEIKDKKQLREKFLEFCDCENLKGKILLSDEGINGNLTGDEKNISNFVAFLKADERFEDMQLKYGDTKVHNFKRLLVKLRKEIITTGFPVKPQDRADYIEPKDFKKQLDNGEEIVIIDARNDYETEVGKFEGAIELPIKVFSEFPDAIKKLDPELKKKKVVTYCTGGVRCEKASALLKKEGFENVFQLHGGIIRYGEEVGDSHWDGKCFVFDTRGAIEIDKKKQSEEYVQCSVCYVPSEDKHTCPNCGKEFVMCPRCTPLMEDTCSKFCRNLLRMKREGGKAVEISV